MQMSNHYYWFKHIAVYFVCMVGLVSESQAEVFSKTRYVRIDHHMHTAYVYDEAFHQLPDNPAIPDTSIESLPEGKPLWFLGFNVDVVKRHEDGMVEVVSHDPAYFEMIHHLVITYTSPNRPNVDRCTNRPIGAGSELTDVSWPAGYAYKMDGGALLPSSWHWQNPANVPHHEEVYLRFIELFDDASIYRDTQVTWIGSGTETEPCQEEFAIPPGKSEKHGLPVVAPEDMRLLLVVPHTHDHVKYIELRVNGQKLRRFKPVYAPVPVMHDDVGEGETPSHVHKDHLPSQGLSLWARGFYGPVVKEGDELSTYGKFKNPHSRSIDNMVLFATVWEPVSKGSK